MNKTRHLLASAPVAIAAMAALSATPSLAQDAPVIVLDVPTAASSPAPVIAIPEAVPTATPVTVAEPAGAPAVEATQAAREARAAISPARRTTAERAPTVNEPLAQSAAVDSSSAIEPLPSVTATEVAEIDAAQAELAPIPEPVRDGSSAALLFALLAAGGVGLAAFFLMRSLRRRVVEVPEIEVPVVSRPVEPLEREPVVTSRGDTPVLATAIAEPVAAHNPAAFAAGGEVTLPAVAPQTELERDNLLRRMIAAKPDRANPFQSHKARAKRARLILQSIGTRFTDRKPGIDLSQHTNVWPELRDWRPATA